MLDDKDEFSVRIRPTDEQMKAGFVWVWSLGERPALCLYPDWDVEPSGRKRATPEEVYNEGFRLREGCNPVDPTSWIFDWRLRVA